MSMEHGSGVQRAVDKGCRQKLNGHKSFVVWFTGLPASGKSTLASALEYELYRRGIRTYLLDGDIVRRGLGADLGYSQRDRGENIRRIAEVAKLFVDAGLVVVAAFVSPYRNDRAMARRLFEPGEFTEVYVKCPLYECERRDPKGHYRRARFGEIQGFTGVSAPYEEPVQPELVVETEKAPVGVIVGQLVDYLVQKKQLPAYPQLKKP